MSCRKSKKLKKYRKCVGKEIHPTTKRSMNGGVKGFHGNRDDAKKAFREAAQSCKKKLEAIV